MEPIKRMIFVAVFCCSCVSIESSATITTTAYTLVLIYDLHETTLVPVGIDILRVVALYK